MITSKLIFGPNYSFWFWQSLTHFIWWSISGSVRYCFDTINFDKRCHLLQPLKNDKFVIPKSRYSSIDCYLANNDYNDTEIVYSKEIFETLRKGGEFALWDWPITYFYSLCCRFGWPIGSTHCPFVHKGSNLFVCWEAWARPGQRNRPLWGELQCNSSILTCI